jgi:histidinol-phosphate aminotransferase
MSNDKFSHLANAGIRGLQPYQPGKPIEELERELGLENIVKLASNENPRGPSPKVLQAIEAAASNITRYPDAFEFTAQLAKKTGVAENSITLGNGSNQVLNLIAQVFLSPQFNAVISEHAFVVYPLAVKALGAELRVAKARDHGHDLDAMAALVDENTRIVFIANPNNPTGTWLGIKAIENFLEAIHENVVVVLDEAYFEYVDAPDYGTGLDLLEKFPNLVVTRTFSKAYGLAGLRLGYSVSTPEIADLLNRIREPFNVNNLALVAGIAALEDEPYLEQSVTLNREGLLQVEKGLKALGLEYIPSIGNFVAVRFERDTGELYQKLLERGVIVRPVGVYDMPDYLRVSIGLPEENQAFLAALEAVLQE